MLLPILNAGKLTIEKDPYPYLYMIMEKGDPIEVAKLTKPQLLQILDFVEKLNTIDPDPEDGTGHYDLKPANIISLEGKIQFIDYEDTLQTPDCVFDDM